MDMKKNNFIMDESPDKELWGKDFNVEKMCQWKK